MADSTPKSDSQCTAPPAGSLTLVLPEMTKEPSSKVDHLYVERQPVGEGGQGEVFRAKSPRDLVKGEPKEVIIKKPLDRPGQPAKITRVIQHSFLHEALILKQLENVKGTPKLLDLVLETDTNALLMVITSFRGSDMFDLVADAMYDLNQTQRFQQFWSVAGQLVDILCAIHAHGIVHRDLNPRNIMMTPVWADPSGPKKGSNLLRFEVNVIDFGAACFLNKNIYRNWAEIVEQVKEDQHLKVLSLSFFSAFSLCGPRLLGNALATPPEVYLKEKLTPEQEMLTDVFGLGFSLYVFAFAAQDMFYEWRDVDFSQHPKAKDDPRLSKDLTFMADESTDEGKEIGDFISNLVNPKLDQRKDLQWARGYIRRHTEKKVPVEQSAE